MTKTLTRIFTIALLTMVSMSAWADIDVQIANDGVFTGGTIKYKEQTKPDEKGFVTVTITVTPDKEKGYTISKNDIIVVSTYPPSGLNSGTRSLEISEALTLYYNGSEKEDIKDLSAERDYTFKVSSGFGAWVKESTFLSDSKGGGKKRGVPTPITSLAAITSATGDYIITTDIDASGFTNSIATFSGSLTAQAKADGTFPVINGLTVPLFATATNAIISNIILDNVSISQGGKTGSIACVAKDATRIYNCGILSGSVESTGTSSEKSSKDCCGGLVGELSGTARVINCYSYATIAGGNRVAGIVGYNTETTTAASINTMVMNCMFYGDITGGNVVNPVYGGNSIDNLQGGLNTFNYYAYDELKTMSINYYNCALAVEEKYLNRFEFYRLLLNSNKKLAAFYASIITSDPSTTITVNPGDMAKWVLETATRTINNPKPYPILKAQRYYPSIINLDISSTMADSATVGRNHGGKLPSPRQSLSVTISTSKTEGGQTWPTDASITTTGLTLTRTDKDFDRFNYNYDKVQLPYYNDVGTGNYTGNKAVTGWKITAITAITDDPYTSANYPTSGIKDYPDHNYADRKSSNKDLYTVSKRIFSQGAYFDVPYGVTSITIEPYWGNAIYVADRNYDVVYKNDYTGKQNVTQTGTQAVDNTTEFNGQKIRTSITGLGSGTTVYDNAVVLVGNFHLDGVPSNGTTPFTMMSVDEDNDHEPDYSLIYHHKKRLNICPIRFDFLDVIGTAQAQKPNGANLICNFTICKTRGWFEVTNTALIYSSQFEYENLGTGDGNDNTRKVDAPLILLGGVFDQFVSTQSSDVNGKVYYIHVGGNVWIKEFGMGTHSDGGKSTPHVPVSVTGGEFPGFYLTGTYKADASVRTDNAECYISGGYFHEAAGASLEQINGNVHWQIYNADIDNFFGGGINDAKPIKGDVNVDIYNSHVTTYCGGPKFGNMQTGKKVATNAEGCVFGTYFGAGYGGTSLSKKKYYDNSTYNWNTLQGYYTTDRWKYFDGATTGSSQTSGKDYGKKGPGVATDFDYEFFVWSSGQTGARFFVKFASFSLAQCNDVESKLKGCTIENNFYGGGSLGKVVGTATSVLEDCRVNGSVYGAGYSASLPTVEVRDAGFTKNPNYNSASGMFEPGVFSGTTTFSWQNATVAGKTLKNGQSGSDLTNHILYTNTDLTTLGQVKYSHVTIKGTTEVIGDVYGGGALASMDESGETMVSLIGGTINGNVYGGGQGRQPGTKDENGKDLPEVEALVGDANVELNKDVPEGGCIVKGNIFGCNNLNGTPKGNATVHIYRTNGDELTDGDDLENIDDTKHKYHLNAVYGGGNLAAYIPTANDAKASVIIDGCDATSIRTVYGGGNAASTPATSVVVNGTYEIEEVFGGGNGKDALPDGSDNPGANVGFKNYSAEEDTYNTKELRQSAEFVNQYVYGSGQANVTIVGGRIHRVFGGSNTKGNVRITAVTMLDDQGGCHFIVDEAYGGGKSAPMDGEAKLLMSCIPGLKVAYGGAENANILGDVTLNITNGNFDRVFGGNNISGTIGGKITVNIEETGCSPIIIGQLYGGGNQAAYNGPWVDDNDHSKGRQGPVVNARSFTSIGEIYGGGYGKTAKVIGDTHVNINVSKGVFASDENNVFDDYTRPLKFTEYKRTDDGGFVLDDEGEKETQTQSISIFMPGHASGQIGAIGNVYGGGNEAELDGDSYVNIGTKNQEVYASPSSASVADRTKTVEGVSIVGNVYGGGNKAVVTGNTNVVIGKQSDTSVTP